MNAYISEPGTQGTESSDESFQVRLIEADLHDEKTGMPVLQLLTALRQYHQSLDFSHQERFGKPDPQSRRALSELKKAQAALRQLTSGTGRGTSDLVIEASLDLKVSSALA